MIVVGVTTGSMIGFEFFAVMLIFMAGTASYYREEISRWMRPELPRNTVDADQAAANALAFLRERAPHAESWNVSLPDPRNPAMRTVHGCGKGLIPLTGFRHGESGGFAGKCRLMPPSHGLVPARPRP